VNTKLNDYLLSVLDKAESGLYVESGEFDRKSIFEQVKHLVDKFDIRWERDTFVPSDDDLVDRVFAAGYQLALDTGIFCLDTQPRMVWTENELKLALETTPKEVTLGKGSSWSRYMDLYRGKKLINPLTRFTTWHRSNQLKSGREFTK
jgi:methylamine--corrinoid protein Co-methyltransferase